MKIVSRTPSWLLPFAIFLIALTTRVIGIGDRAVWMDEDRQAGYCEKGFLSLETTENASNQQQPPIDYYLEALGIQNFGLGPSAIRLHGAILGAVAAALFFLLLQDITKNRSALALGTAIFVFHPVLVRYCQEARPIATGVFFSVVFLKALLSFLGDSPKKRSFLRGTILLTASQLAFFLAVGFQPLPFLMASSLALVPFLAVAGMRRRVVAIWMSTAAALAASFPVLALSLENDKGYLRGEGGLLEMVRTMLDGATSISPSGFPKVHGELLSWWLPAMGLVLLLGTAAVLVDRRNAKPFFPEVYLLLFALISPFALDLMFSSLIKRPGGMPPRYYLTLAPPLICLFAIGLDRSITLILRLTEKRRIAMVVAFVCLSAVLVVGAAGDIRRFAAHRASQNRRWDLLYEMFMDEDLGGGSAYAVNLVEPDRWSSGFWSQRFYYPKNGRLVTLRRGRALAQDFNRGDKVWKKPNVYIVTLVGTELIEDDLFDGISDVDQEKFNGFKIIRIHPPVKMMRERVFQTVKRLREHIPATRDTWILSSLMVNMSLTMKDAETAKRSCDELRAMKPHPKIKKALKRCRDSGDGTDARVQPAAADRGGSRAMPQTPSALPLPHERSSASF